MSPFKEIERRGYLLTQRITFTFPHHVFGASCRAVVFLTTGSSIRNIQLIKPPLSYTPAKAAKEAKEATGGLTCKLRTIGLQLSPYRPRVKKSQVL